VDQHQFESALPLHALVPSPTPIFAFTTDIEWAPEWAIADVLSFFRERDLPLTPFLTHSSAVFDEFYDAPEMHRRVGVHPNFLPNSSHGSTREEVVDAVLELWPQAAGFRSHWFYEDSQAVMALKERGLLWDSNVCLFFQPSSVPLLHHTGLVRFPVFWEDDVHFTKQLEFEFADFRELFEGPGLKVINLHPLLFALNVPSDDFYAAHKHLNSSTDPAEGAAARFGGLGSRTFIEALADHVVRTNASAVYLDDLYTDLRDGRR
jgi:hypothetical protein